MKLLSDFTLVLKPLTWQLVAKEMLYQNLFKMSGQKCVVQQMNEMPESSCCVYQWV